MALNVNTPLALPLAAQVILRIISAIRSLPPCTPCLEAAVAYGLGSLDSRSAAMFIKQLAQAGMVDRAWELFNSLRSMQATGTAGKLLGLLDVYLYTAMISLCSNNREVTLAQELSHEMAALGIPRNVHTFSGLCVCACLCACAHKNTCAAVVHLVWREANNSVRPLIALCALPVRWPWPLCLPPPPAVFVPIAQPEQQLEAKLNIPVVLVKHN